MNDPGVIQRTAEAATSYLERYLAVAGYPHAARALIAQHDYLVAEIFGLEMIRQDGPHHPDARPADPDRACVHEDFEAAVEVNRLTDHEGDEEVVGYSADIRVACANCREPFRWTGLKAGLSPARPMCSVDETVMLAPLRPASADPDFGMGLPGYAVDFHDGDS